MNIKLNNISSLDLFRGIAAYGVAICHFYYYLYNLNNFQFYSIFFVEFFFVLSGFVLTPQLQRVIFINKIWEFLRNGKKYWLLQRFFISEDGLELYHHT